MRLGENQVVQSAQVALDGAADRLTFTPGVPCRLVRFGVLVSVLVDNTQGLILSLDTQRIHGTAARTERGVMTHADGAADLVVGAVRYHDLAAFTMADALGLDSNVIVPGHQAILEVKQAATAGDGFVFLEYTPLSFQTAFQVGPANTHYPVEVAA